MIRFDEGRPATNVGRFVSLLAGRGAIVAVFDPFLTNESLKNFASMATMRIRFGPTLQLMTSMQTTVTKKQLTVAYVQQFMTEVGATGEARYFPHAFGDKQHRRFLLLSSNEVVVVGMSMNFFGHDETASVEPQFYARDLGFFDAEWASATVLT